MIDKKRSLCRKRNNIKMGDPTTTTTTITTTTTVEDYGTVVKSFVDVSLVFTKV